MRSITEVSPEEKTMLLSMKYQPAQPKWKKSLEQFTLAIGLLLMDFVAGILYSLVKAIS